LSQLPVRMTPDWGTIRFVKIGVSEPVGSVLEGATGVPADVAAPGLASGAVAAPSTGLACGSTALAGSAVIIGEGGDETWVRDGFLPLRKWAAFRCFASQDAPQCQDAVTVRQNGSRM